MKLRYTKRALEQLDELHQYLEQRSKVGARNVYRSIRGTVARLLALPHLGRRTDQVGVWVLIETRYGYRVFYCFDDQSVTVIRILHGRQRGNR